MVNLSTIAMALGRPMLWLVCHFILVFKAALWGLGGALQGGGRGQGCPPIWL